MNDEKIIIKFNNSMLAILCSKCRVIIKTGKDFTKEELGYARGEIDHLDPLYCDKCKNQNDDRSNMHK